MAAEHYALDFLLIGSARSGEIDAGSQPVVDSSLGRVQLLETLVFRVLGKVGPSGVHGLAQAHERVGRRRGTNAERDCARSIVGLAVLLPDVSLAISRTLGRSGSETLWQAQRI